MYRCFALLFLVSMFGCGSSSQDYTEDVSQITHIDLDSKKTYRIQPVEAYPAANPETGKRTLMPAMYCPICQKWYPVPPLEEAQRNPESRLCPKDKSPLVVTGPE